MPASPATQHVLQPQLDRVEAELGRQLGRSASRPRTPPAARPARGRRRRRRGWWPRRARSGRAPASGTGPAESIAEMLSTPMSPIPPRSPTMRPRIAVSVPSRVAPSSRSISWPGAGLAAAKSSERRKHEPHRALELRAPRRRPAARRSSACRRTRRRSARPHADAVERQPEHVGEALADHERALGARVDDQRRPRARSTRSADCGSR